MAMGVIWGGLSSYTQADELDAQQVEQMLKVKVAGKLTQADKEEAFKAFNEYEKKASFPKEIMNLVSLETISDYELSKGRRLMYLDNGIYITLSKNADGTLNNFPVVRRYDVTPNDIAEPLPPLSKGINTITKKPYFGLPKTLAANVSDKEYFKTLLNVLNTNFGTLMQMYTLNEKKLAKNGYAGKLGDMPTFYFGEGYEMLEQGMNQTEIDIRRKLGFVVNGASETMKIGGRISVGVGDCTGWTVHSIKLKGGDSYSFVVFNGIKNSAGSLPYYRREVLSAKAGYLDVLRTNFHSIMREHGVEPGTDIKDQNLTTDDQRSFAYIGNTFDNYYADLSKVRALRFGGPIDKNTKLSTADRYVSKPKCTPVKEEKTPIRVESSAKRQDG